MSPIGPAIWDSNSNDGSPGVFNFGSGVGAKDHQSSHGPTQAPTLARFRCRCCYGCRRSVTPSSSNHFVVGSRDTASSSTSFFSRATVRIGVGGIRFVGIVREFLTTRTRRPTLCTRNIVGRTQVPRYVSTFCLPQPFPPFAIVVAGAPPPPPHTNPPSLPLRSLLLHDRSRFYLLSHSQMPPANRRSH